MRFNAAAYSPGEKHIDPFIVSPLRLMLLTGNSTVSKHIATITIVPPFLTRATDCCVVATVPAHSNTTSGPLPSVSSRILSTGLVAFASITSSTAPLAISSLCWLISEAYTDRAPKAFATRATSCPIGPSPSTATTSSFCIPATLMACKAHVAGSIIVPSS